MNLEHEDKLLAAYARERGLHAFALDELIASHRRIVQDNRQLREELCAFNRLKAKIQQFIAEFGLL